MKLWRYLNLPFNRLFPVAAIVDMAVLRDAVFLNDRPARIGELPFHIIPVEWWLFEPIIHRKRKRNFAKHLLKNHPEMFYGPRHKVKFRRLPNGRVVCRYWWLQFKFEDDGRQARMTFDSPVRIWGIEFIRRIPIPFYSETA